MNRFIFLILSVVAVLISACQTSNPNALKHFKDIPAEKAVVVMQMSHNYVRSSLMSDGIDVEGYFSGTWTKLDSNPQVSFIAYEHAGFSARSIQQTRKFEAYVIEPGTYYLSYIKVPTSAQRYLYTKSSADSSGIANAMKPLLYMTFNVQAGDVAYIGSPRVEILDAGEKMVFRVQLDDEYEDALSYAAQAFPRLEGKLKRKLGATGLSQHFPGKVITTF